MKKFIYLLAGKIVRISQFQWRHILTPIEQWIENYRPRVIGTQHLTDFFLIDDW